MDIVTLNKVIAQLQRRVDRNQYMMEWAMDGDQDDRTIDMWVDSKVESQECLNIVRALLTQSELEEVA